MIRNFAIIGLLYGVFGVSAWAGGSCRDEVVVVYINGVLNTRQDAIGSAIALQEKLSRQRFQSANLSWSPRHLTFGYNPTHELLDLVEAYSQKMGESSTDFWRWIADLSIAPKWFQDATHRMLSAKNIAEVQDSSLSLMSVNVEGLVLYGSRVILVAHSQGNFFANSIIDNINQMFSLDHQSSARLVSVATPANRVAGDGEYTTLRSDGLIRRVPHALPPNASNVSPTPGTFDHQFVKHYLNGSGSWPQIERQIYNQASILGKLNEAPPESCQKWFDKINIRGLGQRGCTNKCSHSMDDMETFDCHDWCARLCRCALAPN